MLSLDLASKFKKEKDVGSFKQGLSAGLFAGAIITTVVMFSGGNWWGAVGGMIAGALWHPAMFLIFNRT